MITQGEESIWRGSSSLETRLECRVINSVTYGTLLQLVERADLESVKFVFESQMCHQYSHLQQFKKVVAALLLCSLNGRALGGNLGGAGSSPVFLKSD